MGVLYVNDFSGALDRDVTQEIILNLAANDMPIYAGLAGAGQQRETQNEKFEWYTSDLTDRRTQVNNAPDDYDDTTTAVVVDSVAGFYPNCMVLAEATGEVMYCTAVNTGTKTLTVVRGIGSVVAAAVGSVANDAYLRNIGPALGESSSLPEARHVGGGNVSNWVQTFRKAVQLSGRLDASATLTEQERPRQRRATFEELRRDIEHALIFGAADGDTVDADGKKATSTGGLLQAISTNVTNIGGTMSLSELDTFAAAAFAYGSSEKFMYAGSTVMGAVHDLYRGKLQLTVADGAAGLKIAKVLTPYGIFNLVHHRGLTGTYAGHGIVVDPMQAEIRYTGGGRGLPHLREDVKKDGVDGTVDEWFAELGLQWGSEKHHAVLKGVTGAE